jgi:hypothetical protein
MPHIEDEYRENAELCRRMADNTACLQDRHQWEQLAEAWLRMIRAAARAGKAQERPLT